MILGEEKNTSLSGLRLAEPLSADRQVLQHLLEWTAAVKACRSRKGCANECYMFNKISLFTSLLVGSFEMTKIFEPYALDREDANLVEKLGYKSQRIKACRTCCGISSKRQLLFKLADRVTGARRRQLKFLEKNFTSNETLFTIVVY